MPKVTNNELQKIGEMAIEAICTIYDPEIPVNIYELGLIYDVKVSENKDVKVLMTLTSPSCPVAETLPQEVKERVGAVEGVRSADVEITWDPPWNKTLMSEEARLELGFL